MQSKEGNNLIFIRLFPGEDIYRELEQVCQKREVGTAVVLSGVGQLRPPQSQPHVFGILALIHGRYPHQGTIL